MNVQYLMKHVSYELHTMVRHYDRNYVQTDSICGQPDFHDFGLSEELLRHCHAFSSERPVLFHANEELCYAWIPHSKGFYLVGPVRFPTPVFLTRSIKTELKNESWTSELPACDFQDIISAVLLIYNLHHGEELEKSSLIDACCIPKGFDDEPMKAYSELVFRNQEYVRKHNSYSQEAREQHSIELGDIELLRKSIEEDYIGDFGILSDDSIRNWKYLGVVVITLASRSAIRGGLAPEIAFSISDSYIQEIDKSSTFPRIEHLIRTAEFQFTEMVREQRAYQSGILKKKNPYIEQCKDYIFSHLHNRLEVSDIAGHLALNANYLSEMFHRHQGITLKAYIHQEKIRLVKNLLIYSQYTYSEIAAYLSYSSQSHLGKIFKQITGYTLSQYRREFGVPEFISTGNDIGCSAERLLI